MQIFLLCMENVSMTLWTKSSIDEQCLLQESSLNTEKHINACLPHMSLTSTEQLTCSATPL